MDTKITFLPDGVTVQAKKGDNLLDVAAGAGIYIPASCGGDGVCGKCRVLIESGAVTSGQAAKLSRTEHEQGYRLACQSSVVTDVVIRVPEVTRKDGRALTRKPKTTCAISARSLDEIIGQWQIDPPVEKRFLQLQPPTLDDNVPDLQRMLRAIRRGCHDCVEPTFDHPKLLQTLPFALRDADWQVTVILLKGKRGEEPDRIIAVEPGDTTSRLYGLAVDIGTTTIGGQLLDLNSGRVEAEASAYNGQIPHGEDVISRVVFSQRPGGLDTLQKEVVGTINTIIDEVCAEAGIDPHDISYIMAAGNTIMSHLFLGINPKFIRQSPYVPACSQFPLTRVADLGVKAHESVRLFLYPSVASYVGGDIVAGVHAAGMHKSPQITLYIDIGTNGEIVVGNEEWMVCAACSAGPAFEGGGIKHGMRASHGAIERFTIHPANLEPMIVTVGHAKPAGICGSGLISIVAELLQAGVIDQQGKFRQTLDHPRIREGRDGCEYVLAWGKDSMSGEEIVLTEVDLDNLLRAKGAMFAGYQTLLESVGLTFSDLDRIILAGNFGAYVDLEEAITIGLLPDIRRDAFYYLGNGSLLGARISLTDIRRFRERTQVFQLITNMELSESAEFMNHYMAALFLPHTDMALFPTVRAALNGSGQ